MKQQGLDTVKVHLVLTGALANFAPGNAPEHELCLPAGSKLSDALTALGVPLHEVMGAVSVGTLRQHDHVLSDGESLHVLPVIAGG